MSLLHLTIKLACDWTMGCCVCCHPHTFQLCFTGMLVCENTLVAPLLNTDKGRLLMLQSTEPSRVTVKVKSDSAILLSITIYTMHSLVGKDQPRTPGGGHRAPTGDAEFVKSALMVSQPRPAC